MCHSTESRPPAPPVVGPVTEQGRLDLTSADGTSFAGYQAVPGEPSGASMVVMPDVRGLHPYYEALVARFAEAGFLTAGLDYFGRTAGIGARGGDFEWKQQLDQPPPRSIRPTLRCGQPRSRRRSPVRRGRGVSTGGAGVSPGGGAVRRHRQDHGRPEPAVHGRSCPEKRRPVRGSDCRTGRGGSDG